MIVVVNTIQTAPGYGEVLVERFRTPKNVHKFPGFIRLELTRTEGTEDYEEYKVSTFWKDRESFDGWTHSEAFRQAHDKRQEQGKDERLLGNRITIHEVLVSYGAETGTGE